MTEGEPNANEPPDLQGRSPAEQSEPDADPDFNVPDLPSTSLDMSSLHQAEARLKASKALGARAFVSFWEILSKVGIKPPEAVDQLLEALDRELGPRSEYQDLLNELDNLPGAAAVEERARKRRQERQTE